MSRTGNSTPSQESAAQASPRGKAKTGRPSKLTPAVHDHLVEAIKSGNYIETAVRACGIGVSTYYGWMERGEADLANGKDTPYAELSEAIRKAEGEAETDALGEIRKAARDSWQAAAWYLERKFPARWGRKDRVEHTGKDGDAIKLSHDYDREVDELVAALREQG